MLHNRIRAAAYWFTLRVMKHINIVLTSLHGFFFQLLRTVSSFNLRQTSCLASHILPDNCMHFELSLRKIKYWGIEAIKNQKIFRRRKRFALCWSLSTHMSVASLLVQECAIISWVAVERSYNFFFSLRRRSICVCNIFLCCIKTS
jgi:hypothetical protein